MTDIAEQICGAVDEIVTKRLESLNYDLTILCTIEDHSDRLNGVYTVSNGSAKFEAYSERTDYYTGNNVYVNIPEGDWNQQKFIVGKKVNDTEQPITYKDPFSQFIDISGNIIEAKELTENVYGLLANDPDDKEILIWQYTADDDHPVYSNYSRIGLQAEFQSWLVSGVIEGRYGLQLQVTCRREGVEPDEDSEDTTEETGAANTRYIFNLTEQDMYGNPYYFQTFYSQEKVFDIDGLGDIIDLKLYFFETPGSFKDSQGEIAWKDKTSLDGEDKLLKNLFVSSPYLSFGHDVSEFDEEMISLYTNQDKTYSSEAEKSSNGYNNKTILARWIHKLEDGSFAVVKDDNEFEYTLTFYRYELGHGSADEYSGVYWKILSTHEHFPETNEKGEIISWVNVNTYNNEENETSVSSEDFNDCNFTTWLFPDITEQTEQIKAILKYNGKVYRSKILTFTNKDTVPNKATLDAMSALGITSHDEPEGDNTKPADGYNNYGNYLIYGQNGQLLDQADGTKPRYLVAHFDSSLTGTDVENSNILVEAERVEWIVPAENTMIKLSVDGELKEDGCYHIVDETGSSDEGGFPLPYTIGYSLGSNKINNTVQLKITKNATNYTASKELTFGTAGTSGTDHTLVIDFDNNVTALTQGDSSAITVSVRLYNFKNEEVDISDRVINWSWKTTPIDYISIVDTEYVYKKELILSSSFTGLDSNYAILQATIPKWSSSVNGWGDYDLTAYLPIPIRSEAKYRHISGPTSIIYNSNGNLDSYTYTPYILHLNDGTDVNGVWSIKNGVEEEYYTPTISMNYNNSGYVLKPVSFYIEDTCQKLCVCGKVDDIIVWSQPLLILQNRYPVAMLNSWDGQLKIDEKNNTILAAKIAAGSKNDDNTFSGVILGDWQDTDSENNIRKNTGIVGFDHGNQAYGFRDDGTAFIGKSGSGRIEFDGEKGTIQSGNYEKDSSGMMIDLDDAFIEAHDFRLNSENMTLNSPDGIFTFNLNSQGKFVIQGKNDDDDKVTLMNISSDSYYLKSANYTSSSATEDNVTQEIPLTGMKINLKDGSIWARSVDLSGTIKADCGRVGNWTISEGSLRSGSTSLNANGTIKGAQIYGSVLTGASISATEIYGTNITAGNLAINNGALSANEIYAETIYIGSGSGYIYQKQIRESLDSSDWQDYEDPYTVKTKYSTDPYYPGGVSESQAYSRLIYVKEVLASKLIKISGGTGSLPDGTSTSIALINAEDSNFALAINSYKGLRLSSDSTVWIQGTGAGKVSISGSTITLVPSSTGQYNGVYIKGDLTVTGNTYGIYARFK